MARYLQMYLDTDFILPIGVSESGNFQKYVDANAERRLWLYFSKASVTSRYEAGEANKIGFESKLPGYLGDFWKHLESNDVVEGEVFRYQDLLEASGIVATLREWGETVLETDKPEVVLNFSTIIPVKARRVFADYVESKLGKVRTFSVELNDLLAQKVVFDNQTLMPKFGDQLFVAQSTGDCILLSTMTWCNNMFMQGEEPFRIEKKGKDFLKMSLVKMVVDYMELMNNMLKTDELEREYLYQLQYADGWLKGRNGDESFLIRDFHYSENPAKIYPPIRIDGKQLKLVEIESVQGTIEKIGRYVMDNILNTHIYTVLVGDVFYENVFKERTLNATSSAGKYAFFNDNAVQEAMGKYHQVYSMKTEDLADLERQFNDKINDRIRISSFVHNAEMLGSLTADAEKIIDKLSGAVTLVVEKNANLMKSWEAFMKRSAFQESESVVDQMSVSEELTVASNQSFEILRRIESNNSLLIELDQKEDFKHIIQKIRGYEQSLRNLREKAGGLNDMQKTLKEKIQKYRNLYLSYQELRRRFDSEHTLSGRKKLVDDMRQMTMEEMPIIDVENIKGGIDVTVERTGGFLGFGVKKIIGLTLHIDKQLPCRGVLIVSKDAIASIPYGRRGVYSVDIERGSQGEVVSLKTTPEQLGLDKDANTFYVKFWPHEEEKIPINRFEITGGGTINI